MHRERAHAAPAARISSPQARRGERHARGRARFAILLALIGLGLLGWAGVSFTATVVATTIVVAEPYTAPDPPAGLALLQGRRIQVTGTPPTEAFTIHHLGKPQTDRGRQLFRVQIDPARSHLISATIGWRSGPSPFQNGFMEVALYYQVHCTLNGGFDQATDVTVAASPVTFNELGAGAGLNADTDLCFRPATNVPLLTSAVRTAELLPNGQAVDRHYLYLIASIMNAGLNIPPGEQVNLGNVSFLLIAR